MPKGTKSTEGFLFPATYTLTAGATANTLVDKQLAAFKDNFAKLDLRYAKRRNLTRYDLLIIASMIEREASLDRERPLIAAVIYNRSSADAARDRRDDPLRGEQLDRPLRVSELERDGPYNTRLRRGLPPTPIGNPGSPRSRPPRTRPARATCSTSASRASRASTRSRPPTRSSSATSSATRPRARTSRWRPPPEAM
jgi:cell division protein YceG involved in septum cleavage